MTEKCFEIGEIQAFLDGELDEKSREKAVRHFSVCGDCAGLLAESESELTLTFSALETELNSLVPSARIRANLYEAMAAERKTFWQKIFGGFSFSSPSIVAFASLLLIAGISTIFFVQRENRSVSSETAAKTQNSKIRNETAPPAVTVSTNPDKENLANPATGTIAKTEIQRANIKSNKEKRAVIQNAGLNIQKISVKNRETENKVLKNTTQPLKNENLVGEENYLKTIATLSETVNSRKDETLRPSARVAFEKDLAVVNDAIAKMQKEVRKDPKNEAAKQLLRASYQNKIDLLSSVADKNELMATLK